MTEAAIIKILAQSIDERKYPFQIPNAFIYSWECDYWTLSAKGETREFEIKISRQDFLKDAKKDKHKECNGANFFYYVCPDGLIKPSEIDKRYGLIYIKNGWAFIEKKPSRLHNYEFNNWKLIANKMYWRFNQLWKQMYIDGKITDEEFRAGFNIELEKHEISSEQIEL